MQIDKSQILDLLRSQGRDDQVQEADQQLPDRVDPQEHAGLLQRFGLDPQELIGKLAGGALGGGGGKEGGLGGGLGGLLGR